MAGANWTPRMENCLVGVLVKQAREGRASICHSPQPILSKIGGVMWWKAVAGRCDCRGGGGCGVALLAMVHGRVGKNTID